MRIKVERNKIRIEPDSEIDEAYIEEVLGLKSNGECAICRRDGTTGTERAWGKGEMVLVIEREKVMHPVKGL